MPVLNYLFVFIVAYGQMPAGHQSDHGLLFREDWNTIPAATPVTQAHVSNTDVWLSLYGPARNEIKKSHHPEIPNDPFYIWSGDCKGNWALTLKHHSEWFDLTGEAKIKWRAKQSGFRALRVIVKLSDDTWLVSDQFDDNAEDWREKEFVIRNLTWRKLNIESVTEGLRIQNPDLSKVAEVGFSDLMTGGGTPASSRLDWMEVYGKRLKRNN
ncbi:MAG: hypothetical protein ABIR06_16870 [Cyclobacteriaceae bacterium]